MMRYSKSPRRSLPGFAVDMALRDMRRKPDPLFDEMLGALKAFVAGWDHGEDQTFDRLYDAAEKARAVIAKAEGR